MDRLWLLIDADDTLWESSVYFEEAIEEFTAFLDHAELTAEEVRQVLDEIELRNVASQGYGSRSFARNLRVCFEHLAQRRYTDGDLDRVVAIGEAILQRPIQVIEGVTETLAYLSCRHHLTLFTKGRAEEQLLKFNRSALGDHFHGVRVVQEKHAEAYREIVETEGMDPGQTWMIGNSPKSDIHPALEAGLGAVLVPHERTWSLELADIPPVGGRFRIARSFRELTSMF